MPVNTKSSQTLRPQHKTKQPKPLYTLSEMVAMGKVTLLKKD